MRYYHTTRPLDGKAIFNKKHEIWSNCVLSELFTENELKDKFFMERNGLVNALDSKSWVMIETSPKNTFNRFGARFVDDYSKVKWIH